MVNTFAVTLGQLWHKSYTAWCLIINVNMRDFKMIKWKNRNKSMHIPNTMWGTESKRYSTNRSIQLSYLLHLVVTF